MTNATFAHPFDINANVRYVDRRGDQRLAFVTAHYVGPWVDVCTVNDAGENEDEERVPVCALRPADAFAAFVDAVQDVIWDGDNGSLAVHAVHEAGMAGAEDAGDPATTDALCRAQNAMMAQALRLLAARCDAAATPPA